MIVQQESHLLPENVVGDGRHVEVEEGGVDGGVLGGAGQPGLDPLRHTDREKKIC